MPIAWRYLLSRYLKIFFLALFSFIGILIVSRMREIAQVAALGTPWKLLLRFILYQIPFIIPLAIPISCLISSMVLYQNLSHTHELTALRAAGVSLWNLILPILLAGAFLALATLFTVSELATSAQLAARKLVYDLTAHNPILLLQNAKVARFKGAYIQMDPIRQGEAVGNCLLVLGEEHLYLLIAKKIEMENGSLNAENVSLITSSEEGLMLENRAQVSMAAPEVASMLHKKKWKIANDHLRYGLLRIKMDQLKNTHTPASTLHKCYSEIARRASLGISTLSFTLMGIAFGMQIGRNQTKKGVLWVLFLAAFSLTCFFIAKELDHLFWIACPLFLLPHAGTMLLSLLALKRVNQGFEA